MPEAGSIPIPKKLAQERVTDMVRISDGRMSGTAYGTVILHVSPEAAVWWPALQGARGRHRHARRARRRIDVRDVDLDAREAQFQSDYTPPAVATAPFSTARSPRPTKAPTSPSCAAVDAATGTGRSGLGPRNARRRAVGFWSTLALATSSACRSAAALAGNWPASRDVTAVDHPLCGFTQRQEPAPLRTSLPQPASRNPPHRSIADRRQSRPAAHQLALPHRKQVCNRIPMGPQHEQRPTLSGDTLGQRRLGTNASWRTDGIL